MNLRDLIRTIGGSGRQAAEPIPTAQPPIRGQLAPRSVGRPQSIIIDYIQKASDENVEEIIRQAYADIAVFEALAIKKSIDAMRKEIVSIEQSIALKTKQMDKIKQGVGKDKSHPLIAKVLPQESGLNHFAIIANAKFKRAGMDFGRIVFIVPCSGAGCYVGLEGLLMLEGGDIMRLESCCAELIKKVKSNKTVFHCNVSVGGNNHLCLGQEKISRTDLNSMVKSFLDLLQQEQPSVGFTHNSAKVDMDLQDKFSDIFGENGKITKLKKIIETYRPVMASLDIEELVDTIRKENDEAYDEPYRLIKALAACAKEEDICCKEEKSSSQGFLPL